MHGSPAHPLRVIKLGGSLLLWPELPRRWRIWLAGETPAANLVVVGGGAMADAVRAADQVHALSPVASHELAIAAMSVSARLFARLLPETRYLGRPEDFFEWRGNRSGPTAVFDIGALGDAGPWRAPFAALEPSWDATSDTLAATLAASLPAAELTLLKSTDAAPGASLAELARAGYVDPCFPRSAAGLRVRCVNLRKVAGT